jgi:hypothetical protein
MTATQLIAFVAAPLALLALGWAVALAVDWKGAEIAEMEARAMREVLTEAEAKVLKKFTHSIVRIAKGSKEQGHLTKDAGAGVETLESLLDSVTKPKY